MENKTKFITVFLSTVIVIALIHSSIHIYTYGSITQSKFKTGLSGFSINQQEEINKEENSSLSFVSQLAVITEWMLVVLTLLIYTIRKKIEIYKEVDKIDLSIYEDRTKTRTDIDILNELLRDKKSLKVSSIQKTFNVPKETVLEWSKILENGKLATLEYSKLGEPFLVTKK